MKAKKIRLANFTVLLNQFCYNSSWLFVSDLTSLV